MPYMGTSQKPYRFVLCPGLKVVRRFVAFLNRLVGPRLLHLQHPDVILDLQMLLPDHQKFHFLQQRTALVETNLQARQRIVSNQRPLLQ